MVLIWFNLEFGNYEAVYRTAPATPGLLIMTKKALKRPAVKFANFSKYFFNRKS